MRKPHAFCPLSTYSTFIANNCGVGEEREYLYKSQALIADLKDSLSTGSDRQLLS